MPYFEFDQDTRNEWRWRFRADNREIIASGEGYKRFADCEHAVGLIQAFAATAPRKGGPTGGLLSGAMTRNALAANPSGTGSLLSNAMTNALKRT